MPRTVTIFPNHPDWYPPRGTTHVLFWYPPELTDPSAGPDDGEWGVTGLAGWLAGAPDSSTPRMSGPAGISAADLAAFLWDEWGEAVKLALFEAEITPDGGLPVTVAAYWVSPAGE